MRAKRIDQNQTGIIHDIQKCGLSVISLAPLGFGVPDLLISDATHMWLAELKTKNGKLTPAQQKWHLMWRGKPPIIARSFDELMEKIKTK